MAPPSRRSKFFSRATLRDPPLPSFNFLLLCLIFLGTGAALWHGWVQGMGAVTVFVISGWIVSLCLHEFGHAITAYWAGDWTIPETGYLDLDPLRYSDPLLSILLPLVYILIGGFGLPGGAVWINHANIRSALWDSAVSAAGPFANLLFLLFLSALYHLLPDDAGRDIAGAIGVLAYFQATAIILNLLPIPGLDGFGIIRPLLPGHIAAAGQALAAGAGFLLILLVISSKPVGRYISDVGLNITNNVGVYDVGYGFNMLPVLRTHSASGASPSSRFAAR